MNKSEDKVSFSDVSKFYDSFIKNPLISTIDLEEKFDDVYKMIYYDFYCFKKTGDKNSKEFSANKTDALNILKSLLCSPEVKYVHTLDNYGRVYGNVGSGGCVQALKRDLRNYLCNDICIDIDMVNCHPVIVNHLFNEFNIQCDISKTYILNREKTIQYFEKIYNRPIEKTEYICAINNCKYNGPFSDVSKAIYDKGGLYDKIRTSSNDPSSKYNEFNELYNSLYKKKRSDLKNSFMSYVYQTIEHKILMCVIYYMNLKNIQLHTLMYDGCMIYKKDIDTDDLSKFVSDIMEFDIKFKIKEMDVSDDFMKLLENYKNSKYYEMTNPIKSVKDLPATSEALDDGQLCELLFETYRDRFVISNNVIYFQNDDFMWIPMGHEVFDFKLKALIGNSGIYKQSPCKKNPVGIPISSLITKHNSYKDRLLQICLRDCENENIVFNMSVGYIPFKDCVYDIVNKQIIQYRDAREYNLYFTSCCVNDFPTNINENIYQEVYQCILDIFDGNVDLMNEFLCYCVRYLSGFYTDKQWMIAQGERNSGKGILTDFFNTSFKNLSSTFKADNLLRNNSESLEAIDRQLAWLSPLILNRLAFSNEIESNSSKYINGDIIKTITGGDTVSFREAFGKKQEGVIKGGMVVFCNQFPISKTNDVYKNLLYLDFPCIFVHKNDIETETTVKSKKIADFDLKDKIRTFDYQQCFIKLVINSFTADPNYRLLKKSSKEYIEELDIKNPYKSLDEVFEYTNVNNEIFNIDTNIYLTMTEINRIIKDKNIQLSTRSINTYFKSKGCYYDNSKKVKTDDGFDRYVGFIRLR